MNAAEAIAAAIEKLEGFDSRHYVVEGEWLIEIEDGFYERTGQDPRRPLTNDELIVSLHRTIDAQLAILKDAKSLVEWKTLDRLVGLPRIQFDLAAGLARAILGKVSS